MRIPFVLFCVIATLPACEVKKNISPAPIEGTWKLLTGTLIEKGDTTVTDYTRDREMIKIINASHFSFLNHDTNKGSDTARLFAAGGGKYSFADGAYTEFLEYCSDRQWEGHEFKFNIEINGDTLVQTGTEVIENLGIDRLNIEKYVRLK